MRGRFNNFSRIRRDGIVNVCALAFCTLLLWNVLSCAKSNPAAQESKQNCFHFNSNSDQKRKCFADFQSGHCISLKWQTPVVDGTDLQFDFGILDKKSDQLASLAINQQIKVELFMPSMGHGSDPITVEPIKNTQEFKATHVFFSMTGEWELRFFLMENQVVKNVAKIPVCL